MDSTRPTTDAASTAPASGGGRPRGRPTATEAAALNEQLRRAAVDVFLEQGYERTTMETVAQAAGITKRTLYARYPDKRALFLSVISWALARQERDERLTEPVPDDLVAGLTAIARTNLARAVDPDIVRLSRMAIAESARFPEFAASSHSMTWSPRMRAAMDLLRRHAAAGTVQIDDLELAAEHFLTLVSAMPAWLAVFGISRTPENEERHLRYAVTLFLNGVLAGRSPGTATPPPPTADPSRPLAPTPDTPEGRTP
ncbi:MULTISPECIES: TetR/AcrR family transcriptional regulator [Pseudofrankia]|uniref:TetR/AcrR family transcriptional regulator n=1 Tax=Pseudofrankia TaxID=2994363 RepID=UPI000234C494|nr:MULTISPECIES: TetR/AcrR family transcriptional regulator [Pseudofrankia]OHV30398.1 TetR family transcriptional regulator [Pseudofrankia sp. EUN1h]